MTTERVLPQAEWPRLQQFFDAHLKDKLPTEGVILISENEAGKLIGVCVLQKVWHVEPVWVAPRHRNGGVLKRLLRLAYQELPPDVVGVLCYTTQARVARLIQYLGLKQMAGWQVFRWLREENT